MPTIKDVALLAGVSISTVSIILNGKAKDRKISFETQNKVMDAMKTLNYRPSVSAKKLRSNNNKEYTIGIYWAADFRANLLARLITGIQSEILKYNYPINMVICPYKNDYLYLEKGLHSGNTFNAAIIANTSPSDMDYLNNEKPQIPIVLYNRFSEQYHTVTIDNMEAGRKAAMVFIDHHIKDIGAILVKTAYLAMSVRSQSFISTCLQYDIKISDENRIFTENSILGGVLAAEAFLKLQSPPKAIYCDSDSVAQGVLYVFNKNGIKVPQDVSIITIGTGSPDTNKYSTPPLSVVEIPMEKMAANCVKLIIDVLEHRLEELTHIYYDSELLIRDSCNYNL